MNLFNLLIHSFSIIAVFKRSVIVRSVLIFDLYICFLFPVHSFYYYFISGSSFDLIFLFLIIKVSFRENIQELNTVSLENINSSIDILGDLNSR